VKKAGKKPLQKPSKKTVHVAIIMGSDSDYPVMKDAVEALKEFGVKHEVKIVSAHRTPVEMAEFANSASERVQDALLSIVQMPKGVPVATVAIGNAYNAGLLAVQILAAGGEVQDFGLLKKMIAYKSGLRKKVLAKKL
jgi:phosphoribosylcarboxyaminoimidazole (NCAIR) mutase